MRNSLWTFGAVVILAVNLLLWALPEKKPVQAQEKHRFETISRDKVSSDEVFKSYHDTETGNEIVCVYSRVDLGWSASCFQTGRRW